MPPLDPAASRLFARIGSRKPDYNGKDKGVRASQEAVRALLEKLGGKEQAQLTRLWGNWNMVMGPDLAALAIPLGSRKRVLLVGGEDNMAMQELMYQIPEMLERVNAFMDSEYFAQVEVRLLLGREALDARLARAEQAAAPRPTASLPPRPERLGGLLGQLDPESPVGRCYAAYLRMYAGR